MVLSYYAAIQLFASSEFHSGHGQFWNGGQKVVYKNAGLVGKGEERKNCLAATFELSALWCLPITHLRMQAQRFSGFPKTSSPIKCPKAAIYKGGK